MESVTRSLNYELPQRLQYDEYAQHILENSKAIISSTATPTITASVDGVSTQDFLQKLGATLLNSIQLQNLHRSLEDTSPLPSAQSVNKMEVGYTPNHVIIDSSSFDAMDELQKQLEYDKFMNDVWLGIVLTLILISLVFCVCSCFLYHQFRMWKRNYHSTVAQVHSGLDIEAIKQQTELDDPVPEYTLVSGLPSYEAAMELLHQTQTSKTCLFVYPSVFSVFNRNEKVANEPATIRSTDNAAELAAPLLTAATTTTATTTATAATAATATIPISTQEQSRKSHATLIAASYVFATNNNNNNNNTPTGDACVNEKSKQAHKCPTIAAAATASTVAAAAAAAATKVYIVEKVDDDSEEAAALLVKSDNR